MTDHKSKTRQIKKIDLRVTRMFVVLIVCSVLLIGCSQMLASDDDMTESPASRRVPAEWEPHESTWLQWPKGWEKGYQGTFSEIVNVLQAYEPVNLIVEDEIGLEVARNFLDKQGVPLDNILWHVMPYDWAWMRDNGPVWVETSEGVILQDWGFNAWGEITPDFDKDDAVPCNVAEVEGIDCEKHELIYERGTLEFNGAGTLIASWPVMQNRNPDITKAQAEAAFQEAFGVDQIIWILGAPRGDITGGHVDGIARFINETTVVVARHVDQDHPEADLYENAADTIAKAGFEVRRLDIPGYVSYRGARMPAIYVNWLVANDVVVMTGFGETDWDNAAKETVESYFPGRDVVVIETLDLWYSGGGVHCVTNDQPKMQP
jgi:agmatine deiminase